MKTGDVLCRIAQLQLIKNVVTNTPSCACGESCDRAVGKMNSQTAQLAVLGPEFVPPLGDAMSLVDGEKCDGHTLQPANSICSRQPFRRKIKQTIFALARFPHH